MSRQTRRTFLKKTAAATAGIGVGLTLAGTKASGQVLGANDTIRLGVAGINRFVSLMPLKFLSANNTGSNYHASRALQYATEQKQG